jgi:ribonuclease HI
MKKIRVYTDGSYREETNLIGWAWLATDGEDVLAYGDGSRPAGGRGNYDVEKAEASALKEAVDWIRSNATNVEVITDSKSLIDKIEKKCSNATKDPAVPYIQRTIEEFNRSPLPISISLRWQKRRTDEWQRKVDDWASSKTNSSK